MPNLSKSTANAAINQTVETPKKPAVKSKNSATRRTASNKVADTHLSNGIPDNITEMLDTEYRGISLYMVAMTLLIIAILWTGISVVEQIQTYHQRYGTLLKLKRDFRQLQIEHQRMLIEQQTFSGTPQVTNRAVSELNMYYPNLSDRMILHTNQATQSNAQHNVSETASASELASTVQP